MCRCCERRGWGAKLGMPFQFFERNAPSVFDSDSALVTYLLQSQPGLVFIKDEKSRLIYANEAFLSIYAPEQRAGIIGTTTVESFTPEEAALFLSEDRRAFREGHSEMVEEVTDWTGRKISLLSRKVAVTLANGEKAGVFFDRHHRTGGARTPAGAIERTAQGVFA